VIHLPPVAETALELRRTFDRAYALPPQSLRSEHTENLLAIGVAANRCAIRMSEIAGLASDRKVIPLPSPIPELVGLAGIRGALVPVYSLAALLGHNRDVNHGRWLVLCGKDEPIGLAVGDFEGYLRVPVDQIYAADKTLSVREHVRDAVQVAGEVRMIVSISSVLEAIQKRCGASRVPKER
jgi:chemotaxis signal transduction protein